MSRVRQQRLFARPRRGSTRTPLVTQFLSESSRNIATTLTTDFVSNTLRGPHRLGFASCCHDMLSPRGHLLSRAASARLRDARRVFAHRGHGAAWYLSALQVSGGRLESNRRAGPGCLLYRGGWHEIARLVRAACTAARARPALAWQCRQRDAAGRNATRAQSAA